MAQGAIMPFSDSFLRITVINLIIFLYGFSPISLPYLRNLKKEPRRRVTAAPASRSPQEVHVFALLNISHTPNSVKCAGYVQSPTHCSRDIADPSGSGLRAFAQELSKKGLENWSRDDLEHLASLVLCDEHIYTDEFKKQVVERWESIENAAAVLTQGRERQEQHTNAVENEKREGSDDMTLVDVDEDISELKYRELEERLARLAEEHNRLQKDYHRANEDTADLQHLKGALKTANHEIAEKVEVANLLKVTNDGLRTELASKANESLAMRKIQEDEPPLAYWRNALKTSNTDLAEKDEVINQVKATNSYLRKELAVLVDQGEDVDRLTALNKRLKRELDDQVDQYIKKEMELNDAKRVVQDLTAKTAELDAAKRSVAEYDSSVRQLEFTNAELEAAKRTLMEHGSALEKSKENNARLEIELARMTKQYTRAQQDLEIAKKSGDQLESVRRKINEELMTAKQEAQRFDVDHQRLVSSLEVAQKELGQYRSAHEHLEHDLRRAKEEIQHHVTQHQSTRAEFESSKKEIAENGVAYNTISRELETTRKNAQDYESKCQNLKEELENHKRNLSSAETRIRSLEREIAVVQEDAETRMLKLQTTSREQAATVQAKFKSTLEELETTKRITQEQQARIEHLERESADNKNQAQKAMDELADQIREARSQRETEQERPKSSHFSLRDSWGRRKRT
jgi:chromosome segregation ATPase